jgi:hypothetical protein
MATEAEVKALLESRLPCLCGCGGFPKGKKARFVPGHDARYHSAQKKAAKATESPEAPANPPDRPQSPARPRAAKGDTSRAAGSEA